MLPSVRNRRNQGHHCSPGLNLTLTEPILPARHCTGIIVLVSFNSSTCHAIAISFIPFSPPNNSALLLGCYVPMVCPSLSSLLVFPVKPPPSRPMYINKFKLQSRPFSPFSFPAALGTKFKIFPAIGPCSLCTRIIAVSSGILLRRRAIGRHGDRVGKTQTLLKRDAFLTRTGTAVPGLSGVSGCLSAPPETTTTRMPRHSGSFLFFCSGSSLHEMNMSLLRHLSAPSIHPIPTTRGLLGLHASCHARSRVSVSWPDQAQILLPITRT